MAGPDALAVLAKAGRGWRLPHAAMLLAQGGVPVFPCAPGGKTPLIRDGRGFLDATTEPKQVRAWWRRSPWANIGIPTGGQHAYFPAIPGVEQRSWQAGDVGIDFRGDGGYIVAPPSVRMMDGIPTRYKIADEHLGPASPVDSARLRDFLDPRPTSIKHPVASARDRDGADPGRLAAWLGRQATDLEAEGLELNRWVDWLRHTYGLPASVIPPMWHRHPELLWELSALHLHWLCAYDPEQNGSAPLGWHRDFADARQRLRDWVATSGTRLDRDRPTRQTTWPGEAPAEPVEEAPITDRDEDFVRYVLDEVATRQAAEDAFFAGVDPTTGEVQ